MTDERHSRGYIGERLAAHVLDSAGHKILYAPTSMSDTLKPGADIITLKDGHVWLWDNKALSSGKNISSATAINENVENAIKDASNLVAEQLADPQHDPIWDQAQDAIKAERIMLAAINANTSIPDDRFAKGLSDKLAATIEFHDARVPTVDGNELTPEEQATIAADLESLAETAQALSSTPEFVIEPPPAQPPGNQNLGGGLDRIGG